MLGYLVELANTTDRRFATIAAKIGLSWVPDNQAGLTGSSVVA